jgi:predicted O-methyltransferase YrrM
MKIQPVIRYIRNIFLLRHRNGHGIHSPFFFEIINTLGRNKSNRGLVYKAAEAWRGEMLQEKRSVMITDFGTGSSGRRPVCTIASQSSVNRRLGRVLSYFAMRSGERPVIELGTSLGVGTLYMALANPSCRIITIEGCREIAEIAETGFKKAGIDNIEVITGNFDTVAPKVAEENAGPGLVFIDGNHRGSALKRYFDLFAAQAAEETVIIADDIDYSADMTRAWEEIRQDGRVTGSLDLGRAGILFFRPGLNRQSYFIGY